MKVAILWQNLSGYLNASLRALAERVDDIFVCHRAALSDAPYQRDLFSWLPSSYEYQDKPDLATLATRMDAFEPDLILISSWHIKPFMQMAMRFRGQVPRILCMDNQWLGTVKQFGGILARSLLVRPYYDFAFVPGEEAARFARYLGFKQDQLLYGLYSADTKHYAGLVEVKNDERKSFVQISRLAPTKGIDVLLKAYAHYRTMVEHPWSLVVCGTGPQKHLLTGLEGVEHLGFVGPGMVAKQLSCAGCFVLASLFEPWGVAIHEAACASLPIICTTVCGASTHLVQDGYNGFLVAPGSPDELASAMRRVTLLSETQRSAYGEASRLLSAQFSARRWAETVLRATEDFPRLRDNSRFPWPS